MTEQNGQSTRVSFKPAWLVILAFLGILVIYGIVFGAIGVGSGALERERAAAGVVPQDPDQLNYPAPGRTIEDLYMPGREPPAEEGEASEG